MAATKHTPFKTNRVGIKPHATPEHEHEGKTFVACKAGAEGNTFENTGRQVLVLNNEAAAEKTVTFKDKEGNKVATVTLEEESITAFGPFDVYLYGETLTFEANSAEVKALVITLNELKSVQVA